MDYGFSLLNLAFVWFPLHIILIQLQPVIQFQFLANWAVIFGIRKVGEHGGQFAIM